MGQVQLVKRPRRWDQAFASKTLPRHIVGQLLAQRVFAGINPRDFPQDLPPAGIIAKDSRIRTFQRGKPIFKQGDYGTSLFVVLKGSVTGFLTADFDAPQPKLDGRRGKSLLPDWLRRSVDSNGATPRPRSRKADKLRPQDQAYRLGPQSIFGEVEALTRSRRKTSFFADTDNTVLLEIRWAGVRDLRHWSDAFRHQIDSCYHRHTLEIGLRQCPLFNDINLETIRLIAKSSQLKTYGSFSWTHDYARAVDRSQDSRDIVLHEPVILEQGDYMDDLLVIAGGFARVSGKLNTREKTAGYLKHGAVFGLQEYVANRQKKSPRCAPHSLRAIGYTDVIHIPIRVVEAYLRETLSHITPSAISMLSQPQNGAGNTGPMLDFTVDKRLINGAQAMVIDTNRCVNCDDCVRACAATHNNVARFNRRGPAHNNLMVANACMHCLDPVCLIDCPTGAIDRDTATGSVIVNEKTCIGCGTCSAACPYGNIEMKEVRNPDGAFYIDEQGAHILRATKCDLCTGQKAGPACQRACPHDALIRVDIKDGAKISEWLKHAN